MKYNNSFNFASLYTFESEILLNKFLSVYLDKNINLKPNLLFYTNELFEQSPILEGLIFTLHLADFYSYNSAFFKSIGDPELPLINNAYYLEDPNSYKIINLALYFNEETSMCPLKIPNILGFNEPSLNPDTHEFNEILETYQVPSDLHDLFTTEEDYRIDNTFLFSNELDNAIDKGYGDTIINYLKDILSIEDNANIFRLEIVNQDSLFHLKNFFKRRSDLKEHISNESFYKNMSYKYNICISKNYFNDDFYYSYNNLSNDDLFNSLQSFLEISKLIKKVTDSTN